MALLPVNRVAKKRWKKTHRIRFLIGDCLKAEPVRRSCEMNCDWNRVLKRNP